MAEKMEGPHAIALVSENSLETAAYVMSCHESLSLGDTAVHPDSNNLSGPAT